MAKKKDPAIDDDFDLDDDFGLSDLDDIGSDYDDIDASSESTDSGKNRKPMDKVKGIGREINAQRQALGIGMAKGIGNRVAKQMPGVEKGAQTAITLTSDVKRLSTDVRKDLSPLLNQTKVLTRQLLSRGEDVIPSKMYKTMMDKLSPRDSDTERLSPEEEKEKLREGQISGELTKIAAVQMKDIFDERKRQAVQKIIDDRTTSSRHTEISGIVATIANQSVYHTKYLQTTMSAYFNKSLELRYRQLYIMQDLVELTRVTAQGHEGLLDAIRHNTSIPDSQKIHMTEILRRDTRDQMMGGIQGFIGNYTENIRKKIKENYIDPALEMIGGVNSAAEGLNMIIEMEESMGGKFNAKKTILGQLLGMGGKLLGGKAAGKMLERIPLEVRSMINDYGSMGMPGMAFLLEKLKSGELEFKGSQELASFLDTIIPDMDKSSGTFDNDVFQNITAPGAITKKFTHTVETIIPGYLSMMTMHLTKLATGRETPRLVYDFKSQSFRTQDDLKQDLMTRVYGDEDKNKAIALGAAEGMREVIAMKKDKADKHMLSKQFEGNVSEITKMFMNLANGKYVSIDVTEVKKYLESEDKSDPSTYIKTMTKNVKNPETMVHILYKMITKTQRNKDGSSYELIDEAAKVKMDSYVLTYAVDIDNYRKELGSLIYDQGYTETELGDMVSRDESGNLVVNNEHKYDRWAESLDAATLSAGNQIKDLDPFGRVKKPVETDYVAKGLDWIKKGKDKAVDTIALTMDKMGMSDKFEELSQKFDDFKYKIKDHGLIGEAFSATANFRKEVSKFFIGELHNILSDPKSPYHALRAVLFQGKDGASKTLQKKIDMKQLAKSLAENETLYNICRWIVKQNNLDEIDESQPVNNTVFAAFLHSMLPEPLLLLGQLDEDVVDAIRKGTESRIAKLSKMVNAKSIKPEDVLEGVLKAKNGGKEVNLKIMMDPDKQSSVLTSTVGSRDKTKDLVKELQKDDIVREAAKDREKESTDSKRGRAKELVGTLTESEKNTRERNKLEKSRHAENVKIWSELDKHSIKSLKSEIRGLDPKLKTAGMKKDELRNLLAKLKYDQTDLGKGELEEIAAYEASLKVKADSQDDLDVVDVLSMTKRGLRAEIKKLKPDFKIPKNTPDEELMAIVRNLRAGKDPYAFAEGGTVYRGEPVGTVKQPTLFAGGKALAGEHGVETIVPHNHNAKSKQAYLAAKDFHEPDPINNPMISKYSEGGSDVDPDTGKPFTKDKLYKLIKAHNPKAKVNMSMKRDKLLEIYQSTVPKSKSMSELMGELKTLVASGATLPTSLLNKFEKELGLGDFSKHLGEEEYDNFQANFVGPMPQRSRMNQLKEYAGVKKDQFVKVTKELPQTIKNTYGKFAEKVTKFLSPLKKVNPKEPVKSYHALVEFYKVYVKEEIIIYHLTADDKYVLGMIRSFIVIEKDGKWKVKIRSFNDLNDEKVNKSHPIIRGMVYVLRKLEAAGEWVFDKVKGLVVKAKDIAVDAYRTVRDSAPVNAAIDLGKAGIDKAKDGAKWVGDKVSSAYHWVVDGIKSWFVNEDELTLIDIATAQLEVQQAMLEQLQSGIAIDKDGKITNKKEGWWKRTKAATGKKVRSIGKTIANVWTETWRNPLETVRDYAVNRKVDIFLKPDHDGPPTEQDLLLPVEHFNKGVYFDREGKKQVKSVTDINKPVYAKDGTELISKEDIRQGLCDSSGRRIRTAGGIYGRFARSVVGNTLGLAWEGIKAIPGMGKGIKAVADLAMGVGGFVTSMYKIWCDVFLKDRVGEGPLVTAKAFKKGLVVYADGKRILSSYQVDQPVMWTENEANGDLAGTFAITSEDIQIGLVDKHNKPLTRKSKKFGSMIGIANNAITGILVGTFGFGGKLLSGALNLGWEGIKAGFKKKDPFIDVYTDPPRLGKSGNPLPSLYGKDIKAGKYGYADGTTLKSAYGIDREIYNLQTGKVIIKESEIEKGLLDAEGNKLTKFRGKSLFGKIGGVATGLMKWSAKSTLKIGKMLGRGVLEVGRRVGRGIGTALGFDMGPDMENKIGTSITEFFSNKGGINRESLEEIVGKRLDTMISIMSPKSKAGDKDGDGDRDGGYRDQMQKDALEDAEWAKKKAAAEAAAKGKKGNTTGLDPAALAALAAGADGGGGLFSAIDGFSDAKDMWDMAKNSKWGRKIGGGLNKAWTGTKNFFGKHLGSAGNWAKGLGRQAMGALGRTALGGAVKGGLGTLAASVAAKGGALAIAKGVGGAAVALLGTPVLLAAGAAALAYGGYKLYKWFTEESQGEKDFNKIKYELFGIDVKDENIMDEYEDFEELCVEIEDGEEDEMDNDDLEEWAADFGFHESSFLGFGGSDDEEIKKSFEYFSTWYVKRYRPLLRALIHAVRSATGDEPGDDLDIGDIPEELMPMVIHNFKKMAEDLLNSDPRIKEYELKIETFKKMAAGVTKEKEQEEKKKNNSSSTEVTAASVAAIAAADKKKADEKLQKEKDKKAEENKKMDLAGQKGTGNTASSSAIDYTATMDAGMAAGVAAMISEYQSRTGSSISNTYDPTSFDSVNSGSSPYGVPMSADEGAMTRDEAVVGNAGDLRFPTDSDVITSPYGPRNVSGGSRNHKGIDLRARMGDPIYSIAEGKVTTATSHYGIVDVHHPSLGKRIRYMHLSRIYVKAGDEVKAGDILGLSGGTGAGGNLTAYDAHLHLDIREEKDTYYNKNTTKTLDPEKYLHSLGFGMTRKGSGKSSPMSDAGVKTGNGGQYIPAKGSVPEEVDPTKPDANADVVGDKNAIQEGVKEAEQNAKKIEEANASKGEGQGLPESEQPGATPPPDASKNADTNKNPSNPASSTTDPSAIADKSAEKIKEHTATVSATLSNTAVSPTPSSSNTSTATVAQTGNVGSTPVSGDPHLTELKNIVSILNSIYSSMSNLQSGTTPSNVSQSGPATQKQPSSKQPSETINVSKKTY